MLWEPYTSTLQKVRRGVSARTHVHCTVHIPILYLWNGWTDCGKTSCTARDPPNVSLPQVSMGYLCTCARAPPTPRRRRHGFLSGGRIVGRWPTHPQNALKIGKDTGFGPFHSRIWSGRPLLNFSLRGTCPFRSPAFDTHAFPYAVSQEHLDRLRLNLACG